MIPLAISLIKLGSVNSLYGCSKVAALLTTVSVFPLIFSRVAPQRDIDRTIDLEAGSRSCEDFTELREGENQ